jgi:hypothetical protein
MGVTYGYTYVPQVLSEKAVQPPAIYGSHSVAIGEKREHLSRIPKASIAGYHRRTLRV